MRERRPSQTAMFVALGRALANDGFTTVPGFSDPPAHLLLSPAWTVYYRLASRWARKASPQRRARGMAQLDVIAMRVAAIDAEVDAAVAGGCRQLVILGAGLDTRAFRMASLASVAVFEVDHPATQAYKQRKSSSLRCLAKSLAFVPVDFERSSLSGSLRAAGFRSEEQTAWVWEGVVMYLTDEAVRRSLEDIARCSSPGSVLIVNYHEPNREADGRDQRLRRILLAMWREPQIGKRAPEAMRSELMRAGFEVVSDTRPSEWARRLGANEPSGQEARIARLLVAKRAVAG